jgi:tRNA(Arg) A34 adenosine deaminase TadA
VIDSFFSTSLSTHPFLPYTQSSQTKMNDSSTSNSPCVFIDAENQLPPLRPTAQQIKSMLLIIENEILSKTKDGVNSGNKVFGAAILKQPDFSLDYAETNAETTCPLFHGEVHCIYQWSKRTPAHLRGPAAQQSIFLSTHEPCMMCISYIVWAGFPTVYYFFPYSKTTEQGIPHDVRTMHELWGVSSYRKQNKYCSTGCLMELIEGLEDGPAKDELKGIEERLVEVYVGLSEKYHSEKAENPNNSLVLG